MKRLFRDIIHWLRYRLLRNDMIVGPGNILMSNSFEGNNKLGRNNTLFDCRMGRGSYLGDDSYFYMTSIGRYCSIASQVKVIPYAHPTDPFVSTHPAFFSPRKQAGFTYTAHEKFKETVTITDGRTVEIGNDVWIGEDVIIMGGVRIGDGAIIGAKALVTKDVEPYTIVGGVPAKKIRDRFDEETKTFLLEFKWWDRDDAWLKSNADLFSDITTFMRTFKKI